MSNRHYSKSSTVSPMIPNELIDHYASQLKTRGITSKQAKHLAHNFVNHFLTSLSHVIDSAIQHKINSTDRDGKLLDTTSNTIHTQVTLHSNDMASILNVRKQIDSIGNELSIHVPPNQSNTRKSLSSSSSSRHKNHPNDSKITSRRSSSQESGKKDTLLTTRTSTLSNKKTSNRHSRHDNHLHDHTSNSSLSSGNYESSFSSSNNPSNRSSNRSPSRLQQHSTSKKSVLIPKNNVPKNDSLLSETESESTYSDSMIDTSQNSNSYEDYE